MRIMDAAKWREQAVTFIRKFWITKTSRFWLGQSGACPDWKCSCCGKDSGQANPAVPGSRAEIPATFQIEGKISEPICENCLQMCLKLLGRDMNGLD